MSCMVIDLKNVDCDKETPTLEDTTPEEPSLFVGLSSDDAEIDGLELSQAARRLGVSVDEVWRRVRNGHLIARTDHGQVLVYTDSAPATIVEGLPPLPSEPRGDYLLANNDAALRGLHAHPSSALVESHEPSQRQEIALLIDHLSLAKEENREILRLTHDSMARLSEMTDKMLEMKDSMIAAKDDQMLILKQRLAEQTDELRRVLKEKEDLETLTRALQNS